MRKSLSLILCLLLVFGLFAGCSDEDTAKTTEAEPIETTATEIPEESFYTGWISEETTSPETTEAAVEAELNTVVLRDSDIALRKTYVLMAVSSNAPFIAQGVTLNERGTNALIQWLMTENARKLIEKFGEDTYGEAIFTLPEEESFYTGWISEATPSTNTLRLAAEESITESGLLEDLLPVFEEAYGYTVEVTEGSAYAVLSSARSGYADLVLVEAGDLAQTLVTDGFARTVTGFETEQLRLCSMQYLLCGPAEDPAGVKNCSSVAESFAAIAAGECTFLSRGDGSTVHKLEQQFWPKDQDFGSWYISADMEMGPCLVMNEMEGGYILTDKLTWLMYSNANGII